MEKKTINSLYMYDDETLKWSHDGKLYCLHVQSDEYSSDPRKEYADSNITTIACWHGRYSLGDDIPDKEPEDFWHRLVRENVCGSEILEAAKEGKLSGIRLAKNGENPDLVDIYELYQWRTAVGNSEPKEALEYEGVHADAVADYLMDDLTISHCMTLMEPYAEWMPLWLYDHSGITMSCGSRTGQFADVWDSMQVGWIVALKKVIMAELVECVLDENGEKIRVEHEHGDNPPTWDYLTRPLTDETWRKRAIEFMKSDVDLYDNYIRGEVYGFTLYEAEPTDEGEDPDWDEIDSCWEFYGPDIFESCMVDSVGFGLKEALASGEYETGKAVLHTTSYYTF